jgi:hypothetical protein
MECGAPTKIRGCMLHEEISTNDDKIIVLVISFTHEKYNNQPTTGRAGQAREVRGEGEEGRREEA